VSPFLVLQKMDVTGIQDVIVTLEHDVRSLRNKLEVKQQQCK